MTIHIAPCVAVRATANQQNAYLFLSTRALSLGVVVGGEEELFPSVGVFYAETQPSLVGDSLGDFELKEQGFSIIRVAIVPAMLSNIGDVVEGDGDELSYKGLDEQPVMG